MKIIYGILFVNVAVVLTLIRYRFVYYPYLKGTKANGRL